MTNYAKTRRRVLQGITAAGLSIGALGSGSASSGTTYVVTGGSSGRLEDAGFAVTRELAGGSVSIVTGPADAEGDLESVSGVSGVTENFAVDFADPVESAEPQTTDDAAFTDLQWDKEITDTFAAHDYATGEGTRIVIADTGVDGTHPDLEENFNEELSVSFVGGGEEAPHMGPAAGDHGTHVAGTAAATGDVGVTGTAPDAEIVSVRVLGDDSSSFADVLAGADYAARIGADAASFSLGAGPFPPEASSDGTRVATQKVMQDVVSRGTVQTVSSGNAETNLQQGGRFYLPGTVQGAMTISASGPNDELAFYSNYGTNEIEVGAPGGGYETEEKTVDPDADVEWPYPTNLVYSTVPNGGYGWKAGTSMAAPQVAGLVGLVRELEPDMNANQVENEIAHGAELGEGQSSSEFGAGRINALSTVQRI
ncbi:S8 family peptidase [Natronococcus jeotgali]|uniref:Peptidase S8 and S53 subtilisin kexin sedolisin n=1 Tax=Natronococcus jeotgali DSM 18795 TaxID=1227498 RepID=L9XV16_9EURY|nr:S8 family serine peptidase [Natronococcus jeotgali]ELY65590.1 peptidase S8 and S53 subtilisin kexin sedolisin [Natronococcus jeotgali DSM 18795]